MQSGLACSAVWTSKSALPCTAVEDIRHYCPSRLLITLTQSLGRLYIAASAALLAASAALQHFLQGTGFICP